MEFLQDLFLTAFLAVVFSFLIAKLVSVAMFGSSAAESESKSESEVDEETVMRELNYGERLEVKPFESERKAEFVGEFGTAAARVEEIADSVERNRWIDDIEEELRRRKGELEPEREDVVEEESVGDGEGFGLRQESANEAEELEGKQAQTEEIAESINLGGEMEAEHCLQPEKSESEVRFGDIGEDKLDLKEIGEMVLEKSEAQMKFDDIVEENVENEEEIEEMIPEKSESLVNSDDIVEENVGSKEEIEEMVPEKSESEVNFDIVEEKKLENKEEVGEMMPGKSESGMKSDDIEEEKPEYDEFRIIDEALETKTDHEVLYNEISAVESKLERRSGEEMEVKLEYYDDDDDWEGIERSELEKVFTIAAKYVEDKGELEGVGSDVQMKMYGLHKIATEGPCREPQPMALKVNSRAKWNAWQKLGNTSPEVAMEQYVALLSDQLPGWMEGSPTGDYKHEVENQNLKLS